MLVVVSVSVSVFVLAVQTEILLLMAVAETVQRDSMPVLEMYLCLDLGMLVYSVLLY